MFTELCWKGWLCLVIIIFLLLDLKHSLAHYITLLHETDLSNLVFIAHQTIYVIYIIDLYTASQYSSSILASGGAGNWTRDLSPEAATLHHSGMDTLNSDSWFINYYCCCHMRMDSSPTQIFQGKLWPLT